jgi:uridylate kinase
MSSSVISRSFFFPFFTQNLSFTKRKDNMEKYFQGKRIMFVIKIGGSLLFNDKEQINTKLILNYTKTIRSMFGKKSTNSCAIVVGGGKIARKYISASRTFKISESNSDILGIEVAKLNAQLIINALGEDAFPTPVATIQDFAEIRTLTNKIIVCGGFQPGQSTNAVAALLAEISAADKLINLTDVEGVYTSDPETNTEAKLLDKMDINEFYLLIAGKKSKAGSYPLFDCTAANIVRRSKIPLQFINGFKVENLEKAISGQKIGTLIVHS